MSSSPEEIVLHCEDGVKLAGQRYRSSTSESSNVVQCRILCWHGWLDNCRSFLQLGSTLTADSSPLAVDLVAIDFPGHGQSSHKSLDGPTTILMDYVYYVHEAIHKLHWENENITLIGHSMGAAICLMYAAAFPIYKLILLDSLGPQTKPPNKVVSGFRSHIRQRLAGKPKQSEYESFSAAVQTRCATAKMFPGNQYISKAAATELVTRASRLIQGGKLQFLHDPRVKWSSMLFLVPEQVDQLYRDIASTETMTYLLLAEDGMPFDSNEVSRARDLLKPAMFQTLPGSHHFHMDPDSAQQVVTEIASFLK